MPPADPARHKTHPFPGERSRHGGWLSSRCPLSSRAVQELLCARGIDGTHAARRQWWRNVGQDDATPLKRRRAQPGAPRRGLFDQHREAPGPMAGGDHDENVRDILGQSRRNPQAATPCCRTLCPGRARTGPGGSGRSRDRATARPRGRACPGWHTGRVVSGTSAGSMPSVPPANAHSACRGARRHRCER